MLFKFKKKKICHMGISFVSPTCLCMISLIVLKRKKKGIIKRKKNQNTFIWLQACFPVDVKVIWCNFLGDSHFQTNVVDDVESLFDYCLHITFPVLFTHASYTHYTQFFAKFCTYDCVLTNLVIFNCKWFDV